MTERPLVIGVGNRFRRDDGVAGAVLDALAEWATADGVELMELDGEPARLVEAWGARSRVVLVDAVLADAGRRPGEVLTVQAGDAESLAGWGTGVSGHSAGVAEALALATALDRAPGGLTVVGVVGSDFGEGPGLSPAVRAAVGEAAETVRSSVEVRRGVEVGSGAEGAGALEVRRVPR